MALIGSRYSGIRSRTPQSRNRTAKRERLTLGAIAIVRWVSNLAGLVQAARKMLDRRWVSTSKNDVERGESNGTMAGLALRLSDAGEQSRLHSRGSADARARHWCDFRHFQCCLWRAPAAAALSQAGPDR